MLKSKKLKIKKFSAVDQSKLFDFYKQAFNLRYKVIFNHRNWLYRTNLYGFEPLVIEYKDKIVGHAGMISNKIKKKGRIYKCIWFVDYKILKELRGLGLGSLLCKEWMKISPHQLAITNNNSLKVFKRLGWIEKKNHMRAAKIINPLKWIPLIKSFNNNLLEKINFFKYFKKSNYKRLAPYKLKTNILSLKKNFLANEKKRVNNKIIILRDENWFDWRIIESPFLDDYYFFIKDDSFIIIHLITVANLKRLHILYSSCFDMNTEIELSMNVTHWSIENNVDIIWLNSDYFKDKPYLSKIFNHVKPINFVCYSDDKFIKKRDLANISGIGAVDTDSDIIYSS
tara:strand:- start:75 stop:1097 length:1023 start_codon:yes stop_codon:yes gene_type:complete